MLESLLGSWEVPRACVFYASGMSLLQSSQGTSSMEGGQEAGGAWRDPKCAAGWNPKNLLPPGCGDGRASPGRRAGTQPVSGFVPARDLPALGDLRASGRYMEVHRVAEVAALGAAVHRELVHVQVERLRGGGPQHAQRGGEAPEGRERRRQAAPGTAAGPGRHRPPPRRVLNGEREPETPARLLRWGGGWRSPDARVLRRGARHVRGDSPRRSAARPLRSAARLLRGPLRGWRRGCQPSSGSGRGPGALTAPPSGESAGCGREPRRLPAARAPAGGRRQEPASAAGLSIAAAPHRRSESRTSHFRPLFLGAVPPRMGRESALVSPKRKNAKAHPTTRQEKAGLLASPLQPDDPSGSTRAFACGWALKSYNALFHPHPTPQQG